MNELEKKIHEAYQKIEVPLPDESVRKRAIERACEEFDLQKKNIKKIKGSAPASRLMGKVIQSIKQCIGGFEMPTRKLVATFGVAAIALTIGIVISQNQSNLLVRPENSRPVVTELAHENGVKSESFADIKSSPSPAVDSFARVPEQLALRSEKSAKSVAGQAKKDLFLKQPARSATRQGFIADREVKARVNKEMASPLLSMQTDMGRVMEIMPPPSYDSNGRDAFEKIKSNQIALVSEQPVSTFSVDVDSASYSFVRRQLNNGLLPQKDAVRIEELINYFDYDYALPMDRTQPFLPNTAVYQTPWNQHTKLLHIGIKGYDIAPNEKPVSNLVFLLDVSGSMNSSDKLPLLKNSFRMLVETLDPKDTVSIVVYAGAAGVVLEPTKVRAKAKILAALDRLQAGGSTAGGEGIKLAYSMAEASFDKHGVNRVILATDGDFNVGIRNQQELKGFIERKRKSGIFLSVLGFGQGNYNDALMQALAQNGNGNAAYIDSLNEARKILVDEASSTLFPIANDVKIQVEFNPAIVHDYRLIGYATRMLKRQDFNNDQVDAGDIGSGHTVTAIYEITPVDAKEKLIDQLRYQKETQGESTIHAKEQEYAFVKIRYKLPGQSSSKLISVAVDKKTEYLDTDKLPKEMQFAAAVAAFGQILRSDSFIKEFSLKDVAKLATPARGKDLFGYRTEFLNLVRLAETAKEL